MKLKTMVVSLMTLGLSSPLLAAIQPYYMDTSYQLDVMRDQMNKLDVIFSQNQPGGFGQPCGWTCRINISGWMNTDVYFANHPPVFNQIYFREYLKSTGSGRCVDTHGRSIE